MAVLEIGNEEYKKVPAIFDVDVKDYVAKDAPLSAVRLFLHQYLAERSLTITTGTVHNSKNASSARGDINS